MAAILFRGRWVNITAPSVVSHSPWDNENPHYAFDQVRVGVQDYSNYVVSAVMH